MAIGSTIRKYILLVIGFFSLICAGYINSNILNLPTLEIHKQDTALNVNHHILKLLSAGQERILSDLLWITTLLESDVKHYQSANLKSWMFLRFKSIIELDPNFYSAYLFGGKYLNIIKDDLEGSKYIFKKGIEKFPGDYELIYNFAFLLTFEMQNYTEGIKYYKKILDYPKTPEFIKTLVIKLQYEQTQDLESIFPIILNMYNKEDEKSNLRKKMRHDLYSIKSEIDLKCLNEGLINCSQKDFFGNYYLKTSGKYSAKFKTKRYRLNKREKK